MRTRSVVSTISGNSSVPIVDSVLKATRAPSQVRRVVHRKGTGPHFVFWVCSRTIAPSREIEREDRTVAPFSAGKVHRLALAQVTPRSARRRLPLDARPRRRAYVGQNSRSPVPKANFQFHGHAERRFWEFVLRTSPVNPFNRCTSSGATFGGQAMHDMEVLFCFVLVYE